MDNQWETDILHLLGAARTNNGITKKEITAAINSTLLLRDKYKGKPAIPMRIVNILIDMQADLMTSGDRHAKETGNKEMAEKIYRAAFDLSAIARDMTDE